MKNILYTVISILSIGTLITLLIFFSIKDLVTVYVNPDGECVEVLTMTGFGSCDAIPERHNTVQVSKYYRSKK